MEYRNGPNQIIPCDNLTCTDPAGYVKLRVTDNEDLEPISLPGLMRNIATNYPDIVALVTKDPDGRVTKITYKEYEIAVRTCAKAFIKLGLKRYHGVCIIGFNSSEWFISDLAAIHAGGIAVGIYTTNSPEACKYCAVNCQANIILAEDDKQVSKILSVRSQLPELKAIIQYKGIPDRNGANVLSWEDLMTIGKNESDDELNDILKSIAINQCCTLVYTSGTVGTPKAVMLTHDNMICDAYLLQKRLKVQMCKVVLVSYLPLSHVAAQIVDVYLVLLTAGTVHFADKNAWKGSLVNTLQTAQPTHFLGVPRVWEKMYEKMMQIASQNSFFKRAIAKWAKGQGTKHNMDIISGVNRASWSYYLAKELIFKKIKQALGFGNTTHFFSAAAPLSIEMKDYFLSIDMPIMEAYGMSEASGAHTLCIPEAFNTLTVGLALSGFRTSILNPDENQHGEIGLYGRHIFMGYMNDPAKTAEAVNSDGWLCTGDIGHLDDKNMIYVTGRIKEIIITAGGENIAPVPIEQLIKNEMPYISNAMIIGDQRKYLSVLLTLKTMVDPDTSAPLDTLTEAVSAWLHQYGSKAKTVTEMLKEGPHPKVLEVVQLALDKVNKQKISNAQKIQKFTFIQNDFSIATGELGPTMKLKRNVVLNKYKTQIDEIYKDK